jgi:RNA polymerase sigma factor (TIGR02999 family)
LNSNLRDQPMSDVTQILERIETGDPAAAEQLLPLVYQELRKLAAAKLAQEQPGQTLQATALVHEAYLRLIGSRSQPDHWNSRGHFFAAATEAMRRILVEQARRKGGPRRGGGRVRLDLEQVPEPLDDRQAREVLAIHQALDDFAADQPVAAELVKLRYFAGMTQQEASDCLGISRSTADRLWAFAKASRFASLREK